jgi:DNA-directed RNA polymerase II subunit RPB1
MYYGSDIRCVYSDDNSDKLVFRIRIMKFKKSENDKMNDLNILKQISQNMREKVLVKGIHGISSVSMYKNKTNAEVVGNNYINKEEWVLSTNGLNIIEIWNSANVDYTRTHSNDIYEMYETLGIEAARAVLLNEIREVINGSGNYVNYRHLSLLCDNMTNKGSLMSIDRFGINRGNIGPLAKCSFEETTDQLFKASIFGEIDLLNGVSSNIMMGQVPPCGTGDSQIVIDESKFFDVYPEEEVELDDLDEWVKSDYCDNVGFNINSNAVYADNVSGIPEPEIDF